MTLRICTIRKAGVIAGSGALGIGKGSIPGPLGDQNRVPLRVAVSGSRESECISWMTYRCSPSCLDQIDPGFQDARPASRRTSRHDSGRHPRDLHS